MHHDLKKLFLNTAVVVSGGAVSAIFFILLASNRLRLINEESVRLLLLFIPLYNFALLIAKQGVDQWVFAQSSAGTNKRFRLTNKIFIRIIVIDLLFSVFFGFNYNLVVGLLTFFALFFDVTSLIKQSELMGHGQYVKVTVLTVLNYPLFFFLIVFFALSVSVEFNFIIILFSITSLIRWCAAYIMSGTKNAGDSVYSCGGQITVLLFIQIFNYLLFRSDQILASDSTFSAAYLSKQTVAFGVYLWRYPDVFSSLFSYMGGTLYPYIFMRSEKIGNILKKWIVVLVLALIFAGILFVLFVILIWKGNQALTAFCIVPFYFSIILILPVNYFIYSMLRTAKINKLLLMLIVSNLFGVALYFVMISMRDTGRSYFWVVPSQLLVLVVLSLISKRDKSAQKSSGYS